MPNIGKRIIKSIILSLLLVLSISAAGAAAESVYTVQAGDTLWVIAIRNGVTVDQLKQINGLKSDLLQIGERLIIKPQQSGNTVQTASARNSSAVGAGSYVVQSGDTLWGLSQRCGLSVDQIKKINNLSSDCLYVGQKLKLGTVNIASNTQAAPSRSGESITGARLVNSAAAYLGTSYVYGGDSPSGFDCSGFTSYIYKQFGYNLPRTAASQFETGTAVKRSDLLPGDLVFFNCSGSSISHVGIYCGNNRFIHCSSASSGGVIYSYLSDDYYADCYAGARRILS